MASTIKIKRSSVPSKVPTTSDIATGELAINTKDRKIYSSNGTAVFSFTSDYLQVANAAATYTTKTSPTTSGVLDHTGRATISTNLTVSGNTVIGKLVANGSLGTSGYALKSNGSTVYWGAVGSGSSGSLVSLTTATVSSLTQNDTVVTSVSVVNASSYLLVANAIAIYQTISVERAALANTNSRITLVNTNLTGTNTAIRTLVSDRLQVANAAVIYQTKSVERTALANTNAFIKTQLANTNSYIATKVSGPASSTNNAIVLFDGTTGKLTQNSLVSVSNTGAIVAPSASSIIPFHYHNQADFPSATTYHGAIAHSHADGKMYFAHSGYWHALANNIDVNDRLQVANAASIYQTKSIERAALANTNLAITNVKTGLTSTNTAIRLLVSDRLQIANAVAIYQTKSIERAALANTNLAITNVKTGLTSTNTAIRLLVSDRLQVANAVAIYQTISVERSALANTNTFIATKLSSSNPATSGLLAHTGRATISTNLTVSGNNVIGKLVANGSLGTAGYALKTNGSTVYWDAVGSGGGGGGGSNTQYLQVANAVAIYQTISVERAALANTNTFIATKLSSSNPTTSGLLAHTGRATISTNLTVSGNNVIGKLVANGSLGTSGYALKTNGSTVYWGAVGSGGGGGMINIDGGFSSSVYTLPSQSFDCGGA